MGKSRPSSMEILVFAITFAAVCILFYTPMWATGFSLLNAAVSDYTAYLYWHGPWHAGMGEYLSGYFPLWVDVAIAPKGPFVWVMAYFNLPQLWMIPFNFTDVADIYYISRVWAMGFFTYVFARKILNLEKPGAALCAVAFAFSGIAQKSLTTVEMNVPWLLPLFLLSVHELLERRRLATMMLCGFVASLAVVAGHPITAFYLFLMGGLWALYVVLAGRSAPRNLILFIGVGALALLLSGVALIPGVEGLALGWNYHFPDPNIGGMPVEGMFSPALPWMVGGYKTNYAVSNLTPYFGTVIFLLALFGISRLKKLGWSTPFFALYAIIFLGLGYKLPPFSSIGHLPPFDRIVNSVSSYYGITFAVAVLAGSALELALANDKYSRILVRWALAAALAVVVIAIHVHELVLRLGANPATRVFIPDEVEAFASMRSQTLFAVALTVSLAVAAWTLKRNPRLAGWTITAIALFGLFVDSLGWNPEKLGLREKLLSSEAVKYVRENVRADTVIATQCEFTDPNLYTLVDLKGASISTTVFPRHYIELMSRVNGLDIIRNTADERRAVAIFAHGFNLPFPVNRLGTPTSDKLGIEMAIVCREPLPENIRPSHTTDAVVYESDSVPRSPYLTGHWKVYPDGKALLDALVGLDRNKVTTAMFVSDDAAPEAIGLPAPFDGDAGTVETAVRLDQKYVFDVDAKRDAVLVHRNIYYPGWRAWIDGEETRIARADYIYRAVVVPEGNHKVIFRFAPRSFQIPLWALIATVTLLPLLLLLNYIKLGRKAETPVSNTPRREIS